MSVTSKRLNAQTNVMLTELAVSSTNKIDQFSTDHESIIASSRNFSVYYLLIAYLKASSHSEYQAEVFNLEENKTKLLTEHLSISIPAR
jgi:hypothetical protein